LVIGHFFVTMLCLCPWMWWSTVAAAMVESLYRGCWDFFPSWRRGECGCAFYTSYPTTMVINKLYRLHCCALCSFMRWETKSCDSVHPERKNLVAPSFQWSYSRSQILGWVDNHSNWEC
jgi:hypothetical protein